MQCCTSTMCFHCCTGFTKWLNFILAPTDSLGHTLPNTGRKGMNTLHMWCHTLPNTGRKGTYTLHMWCHTLPNTGRKGTNTLHMWCHTLPNTGRKGTNTLHMWCHTLPNTGRKGTHYTCGASLSLTRDIKAHTTHVVPQSTDSVYWLLFVYCTYVKEAIWSQSLTLLGYLWCI